MRRSSWIILGALAAFAALVFFALTTAEPIKVVSSRLEHDGSRIFVAGTVRNTADGIRSVDLEVHYFDRSGRALGQDTLPIEGLGASAERSFRSPPRTIDDVAEYSIYLNNGRNPYGN